ncbi:winged helix-turn-helix domain-containing protein [Enterococcus sp. LJL99]
MPTLGILTDDELSTQELVHIFQMQDYQLINVKEKKQFDQLDGLVINLTKGNNLTKVIDWLLYSKNNPAIFVWVVSNDQLGKEEENILLELGANDVLPIAEDVKKTSYIIRNTFARVDKMNDSCFERSNQSAILNEKNQAVFVNGEEKLLTRTEFNLFKILYEHADITVSYEELLEFIWGDLDNNCSFRLSNIIHNLRSKVDKSDQFELKTIRSKGYMLTLKKS